MLSKTLEAATLGGEALGDIGPGSEEEHSGIQVSPEELQYVRALANDDTHFWCISCGKRLAKWNCQFHFWKRHRISSIECSEWLVVKAGHAIRNQNHMKVKKLSKALLKATLIPEPEGGEEEDVVEEGQEEGMVADAEEDEAEDGLDFISSINARLDELNTKLDQAMALYCKMTCSLLYVMTFMFTSCIIYVYIHIGICLCVHWSCI